MRNPPKEQKATSRFKPFRSTYEQAIAEALAERNIPFEYEPFSVSYSRPPARYTPDFVLSGGILLEVKGRFTAQDRAKHLLIKKQHPDLDIRFVFQNAHQRLSKTSKTTYAEWCVKHGFSFSHKAIPPDWLK